MTDQTLHATPGLRIAASEQIRAVGLALRSPAGIALAVALVGTVMILLNGAEVEAFRPERWLLPGLVGALMPIAVWKGEAPFTATMLWVLPVDRSSHALTKVFAGWVWLMAAIAFFCLWLLVLTLVSGGTVFGEETVWLMPSLEIPERGTLDPSALRSAQWAQQPLLWLVPFTAATGTYLLTSALALGSRYPLRWIVGTLVVVFAAGTIVSEIGLASDDTWIALLPSRLLNAAVLGRFGLDTLLSAGTEALRIDLTLSNGDVVPVWRSRPEVADWAMTTVLWITAGLLAVWAAAARHRERRRG